MRSAGRFLPQLQTEWQDGRRVREGQLVGARGFEPPTPCSQGRCASQAALRPELGRIIRNIAKSQRDAGELKLVFQNLKVIRKVFLVIS